LNQIYAGNGNIRFGLVDYTQEELLKVTLVTDAVPRIVVLQGGHFFRDVSMREAYHLVHEFIEVGLKKTPPERMVSVSGRVTPVGLYWSYIIKELALI
jgi:hypothetical protein